MFKLFSRFWGWNLVVLKVFFVEEEEIFLDV